MRAYETALTGEAPRAEVGASRTRPGTVNAAVIGYFNSKGFRSLSSATQATYRGILEGFRSEHGDKRIALLDRKHIERLISKKAETPSAANNLLRMLRVLMQFAVGDGMRRVVENRSNQVVHGGVDDDEGFRGIPFCVDDARKQNAGRREIIFADTPCPRKDEKTYYHA